MFTSIHILMGVFIFGSQIGNFFTSPSVMMVVVPVDHSECPTWDPRTGLLYFVDIHIGRIYSYNYGNTELNYIELNGEVAPVIPSKRDPKLLIVGLNRSILAVEWNAKGPIKSKKVLTTIPTDQENSRLNDGKADKKGRLLIGTMGYETREGILTPNGGALFEITQDNILHPTTLISPVNISNGMAWNKAHTKLYYIDSPSRVIARYKYDIETGKISSRRVIFDLSYNDLAGSPDGMTIDKDDNLWIALYGGGSVIKVNPCNGKLLQKVAIPAEAVTSVAWGGPKLDTLFVTTSRYSLNEEERKKQPEAGGVFAITNLGTYGLPMFEADIY